MEYNELRDKFDLEASGYLTVLGPEEEKARAVVEKAFLAYRRVCEARGWTIPQVDLVVRSSNLGRDGGPQVRPCETRVMVLPNTSDSMPNVQLKQIADEIRGQMEGIKVIVPARIELSVS